MEIGKTLYITKRSKWRAWLSKHHATAPDIWLIFYKVSSGKPRISYDDAVLEALCFGWIDSIVKKADDDSFVQRFSPRKSTSVLSQMNIERIRELIKEKKMTPAGLTAISHTFDPKAPPPKFETPPKILSVIRKNPAAWKNFQNLPVSYKRIRIAYIESRKRHGTGMYHKALKHFIKMTSENIRLGFVKERRGYR